MFFPRKPGLRRAAPLPPDPVHLHRDDALRPKLNLSPLEVVILMLMVR